MKKNLLQKIMCICIAMFVLIVPLGGSVSASPLNKNLEHETNAKIKITFDESEYNGMSELEAGIKKVNLYGLKDDIANGMDEEVLKSIGRSQYMTSDSIYLVENEVIRSKRIQSESSYDLVEVDEETYNKLLTLEEDNIINKLKNSVTIIDENENPAPNNSPLAENETTRDIDSGKMRMVLNSYHYVDPDDNSYFYQVVNQFIWDTMPKGRGTDIFGISRSSNTASFPDSGAGYYEYLYQRYGGYATASGWNPILLSSDILDVPCDNDDNNEIASAIRIDMPIDILPYGLIAGNYYEARIYPSLLGVAWYMGTLSQIIVPSINNINHWGTLAHQHTGKLSLNPSFGISYPLDMAFSINPAYEEKYTTISTSILDTIRIIYE